MRYDLLIGKLSINSHMDDTILFLTGYTIMNTHDIKI